MRIAIILIALLLVGCATYKIADIKSEDYIGKEVKVSGIVKDTIKIGKISGYTLEDKTGYIMVSSETLPKEGDTITTKGTLIKDTLLGYYIKTE